MIPTLLLLGATGDLAQRYLFPALETLAEAGRLPDDFRVIGAGRRDLDDESFRKSIGGAFPPEKLAYRQVDITDASSLGAALDGMPQPVAAYLALPPDIYGTTIESLIEVDLPGGSRIVVEKPFGDDAESAAALNDLLASTDAYRVDHVLGMGTARNLVEMRRANPFVERLWNSDTVAEIQILWEETLGLEGRAGFYDDAGALKDVMQNHMLQLLLLAAVDPAGDDATRQQKLEILRAARSTGESRRARYTAGTLADGRSVPDYADEEGVESARGTETFAEFALELATPRWKGTRWVLRAGKALASDRKMVLLRFRDGGELQIGIDGPTDIVLRLNREGGDPLELEAPAPDGGPGAYANVLLDVLGGTSRLAVGGDEAEEAWRVVAPILRSWETGEVPLEEYPAGSTGP